MSERAERVKDKIADHVERKIDKLHRAVDVITFPLAPIDGVIHGTARGVLNWLTDQHPEEKPKSGKKEPPSPKTPPPPPSYYPPNHPPPPPFYSNNPPPQPHPAGHPYYPYPYPPYPYHNSGEHTGSSKSSNCSSGKTHYEDDK